MNPDSLNNIPSNVNYITNEDIKLIVCNYLYTKDKNVVDSYIIERASDKMLGFLCDYWKLKIYVVPDRRQLNFFIKAISRINAAKAKMIKELKLYTKEINYYSNVKKHIEVPGLSPWSPRLVAVLDDAMVFEDLNAKDYKLRNKFSRFDMYHTLQALNTLARFHASSIIYERKRSQELQRSFTLDEEFGQFMDTGGYDESNVWYLQCMNGALEALKVFTEIDEKGKKLLNSQWSEIWFSALRLSSPSRKYKNVICHRDLWNNNILFHYNDKKLPDDCIFVDFQAIRYQPPAGDLMVLLYCNLDSRFREENINEFLNHYFEELKRILQKYDVDIEDVFTKAELYESAEEQRLWGLVICACLLPQFWIDDDLATEIFSDPQKYDNILSINKGAFIIKMMKDNFSYKEKVMEIFEEIVARYCL